MAAKYVFVTGGVVSGLELPATSRTIVVNWCAPSARALVGVKLQLPLASTSSLPITVPLSRMNLWPVILYNIADKLLPDKCLV